MKKGVLALTLGTVVIGGGAIAGLNYTGQIVDQSMDHLVFFVNQQQDVALSVNQTQSQLLSRQHEISLFIQGTEIRFQQFVQLLPWGANAKLVLVEEGEIFDTLREKTTFEELPLTTSWAASGFSDQFQATINLQTLNIKDIQMPEEYINLSPSHAVINMALDGSQLDTQLNVGGLDLKTEGVTLILSGLTSVSQLSATSQSFMITHSDIQLDSLDITEEGYANNASLALTNLNIQSQFSEAETGTIDGRIAADNIAFLDTAQGLSEPVRLSGTELSFSMRDLDLRALALMEQAGIDEETSEQSLQRALDLQFEAGLNMTLDAKVDDVSVRGQSLNGFQLTSELSMAPSDRATIQHGSDADFRRLLSGQAELQVSDQLTTLSPLPFAALETQGFVDHNDGQYKSILRLNKGVLTANDKPLPF